MSRASNLDSLMRAAYNNIEYGYVRGYRGPEAEINNYGAFMEIPINCPQIEIPTLILCSFTDPIISSKEIKEDFLVVPLIYKGTGAVYKTLTPNIKAYFLSSQRPTGLGAIVSKENQVYYVTKGAIFDKYFNPIMLCTWAVSRIEKHDAEGHIYWAYSFDTPILRIAAKVFTEKSDEMQRFVCGKFLDTFLKSRFLSPFSGYHSLLRKEERYTPEVIIGDIPFRVQKTAAPSCDVSNEDLIQLVLAHPDDWKQQP